jgi:hypothetical protein
LINELCWLRKINYTEKTTEERKYISRLFQKQLTQKFPREVKLLPQMELQESIYRKD